MNLSRFMRKILYAGAGLLISATLHAGAPLWTLIPLTPTALTVAPGTIATVQYRVTNQSKRTHTLQMTQIPGITQYTGPGNCRNPFTLNPQQSCTLTLRVNGSVLPSNISSGPVVCTQGNTLQCYQPSQADSLAIASEAGGYTIGGTLYGLSSGSVVLVNNGVETLTLNTDDTFAFQNAQKTGTTYSVRVQSAPSGVTCTVSNGVGTVGTSNVTNIAVHCSSTTYTIGGNLSGLTTGTGNFVVLQLNGQDFATLSNNGSFTFSQAVASGSPYTVTVYSNPPTQTCTVAYGTGTATANVTNIQVTCATDAYTIGGTVSGLASGASLVLQNNGQNSTTISANGSYTFPGSFANGSTYDVTVSTQPTGQTCTVTGSASGTISGANVTNANVSCVNNNTTLTVSPNALALSVHGLDEYGVPSVGQTTASGVARSITLTNTGAETATGINITYPTFPAGTSVTANSCGSNPFTLAASASCTITITPGTTATSDGTNPCTTNDTAAEPQAITITADNAASLSPTVVVLGYGCIYQGQGGYVYAFDDTTATNTSVGGKTVTTADQAASNGIIWSSNSSGTYDGGVAIYGISDTSTTSAPDPSTGQVSGQTACNGNIDGACDTNNIYTYYQNNATGAPIPTSYYAAGLCKDTIRGHSDWYLPAVCELSVTTAAGCGTSISPTLQNIALNVSALQSTLKTTWSSTEDSGLFSAVSSWLVFLQVGDGDTYQKSTAEAVYCSRAF